VLEPVAMLAPVVTTERYRIDRDAGAWEGFEQRCQSKSVTCIRNEDLEKRPTSNLADFLNPPCTPTNVKAVEVYPPEKPRPLRFQGDPTCGVVVIWTK
jgi:hypothetical protein